MVERQGRRIYSCLGPEQLFSFFDPKKIGDSVHLVDLGLMLRTKGLEAVSALIIRSFASSATRSR